jgi:hypothetical protein
MSDDREIKWEYKLCRANYLPRSEQEEVSQNESRYNELGEDGWELVNVYLENKIEMAWFKRRKASKFIRRER